MSLKNTAGFYMQSAKKPKLNKILEKLNIKSGDIVLMHSSYSRLKFLNLSPCEIIDEVLQKIGKDGTLFMPRYVWNVQKNKRPWAGYREFYTKLPFYCFNKTPTNIGIICRRFSEIPGVNISNSYFWPVCGIGKNSKNILKNQQRIIECFGKHSVFYRLLEKNAKILGMGVSLNTTSLSPVTDFLQNKKYFSMVHCCFKNQNNKLINKKEITLKPEYVKKTKPSKIIKTFKKGLYLIKKNKTLFFSYESKKYHIKKFKEKKY